MMKKTFLCIGVLLLAPLFLFALLCGLLYLPPVQNWAVDKAAEIASEQTGMHISIGHLDLDFPFDLAVDEVRVDSLATIGRAVVSVELMPLLKQQVVVNQLELNDARIDTRDLISDLQIRGHLGLLSVASRGIDLARGTVELNGARLSDADVTVLLSDTAAVDTTTSQTPWLIRADSLTILRSRVEVRLPGDSMLIGAYMGHARATEGVIDLLNELYTVRSLDWHDGQFSYDQPYEPRAVQGLDYSHLSLSGLRLGLDSIYYHSPSLALRVSQASFSERSGLAVTQLQGGVLMDSAGIHLPDLRLATPYSYIGGHVRTDFSVADSLRPGQMSADLQARIGKPDLLLFLADMPPRFRERWPDWPLSISGKFDGNLQQLHIRQAELDLPTALHAKAEGTVSINDLLTSRPTCPSPLAPSPSLISLQAETYDLGFATALLDPRTMKGISIPKGISIKGTVGASASRYTADLRCAVRGARCEVRGYFNQRTEDYDAWVSLNSLNLRLFLPNDSIGMVTASAKVSGRGTDPLRPGTRLQGTAQVGHLEYGSLSLDSIGLTATLDGGQLQADVSCCNLLAEGLASVNARIGHEIDGSLDLDLQQLDLFALGLADDSLSFGGTAKIQLGTDLEREHWVRVFARELSLRGPKRTYHPEDFGLYLRTQPDSTWARIQSGNMIVKMDASGGYEHVFSKLGNLADTLLAQYDNKVIDQAALKRQLPTARIYVTSGRDNPVATILHIGYDIDFKELAIDLTTSPQNGVNGQAHLYDLNADSIRIDTILVALRDSDHGLTFQGRVANNKRNPQFVFRALFDGNIHEHGTNMGLRFYDERGQMGLRLGAKADMEAGGIRLHLLPARPTIGYKEFSLNTDNYLLIGRQNRLQAKIDLIADDGTGVKIYSDDRDSTALQDLTVSLHKLDLEKTTSVLPYVLPRISGTLNGDFHLVMNQQRQISVASDMQIASLIYEHSPIGNLSTEFVYMQREDDTHAIEGRMMLDEREIGSLSGEYRSAGKGYLDVGLTLTRTPMMIVNGLVPDQLIGLEGFAEGEVKVKGPLDRPDVDGELFLEDAFLISKPYGVRLRFDNDPVRIVDSKLLLENFTMYGENANPLNIMGDIDFHDTGRITADLRLRAQNFQLINSKQTKESIAYGKAFVNFYARMNGRLDQLQMRGRLDVLGTTDMTYILLDSPLSTDNQMDELVRFTDFSDSIQAIVEKPVPEGLDMSLNISIDPGVHVHCALNTDQSNYVDLFGGGDLRMKYSGEGLSLTGRYTLTSGQMKYSLPIIPLKTFTLQDGSYVEFTGDPMNPRLNLTATERTKASVAMEGEQGRSVAFDCGVVITKTLSDMGLQFVIKAPEDMAVQNDLNSMTDEQRGKIAVTMLTTGMYLADGNTSGFSMNSALSSFLQSEINSIAGNALKTLDLSVGIDNTTDASGTMHTDYSFRFAKRFWNNRLRVQIGGKVSSGNDAQTGQKQSFFDNVTMEYRISPNSNQYVKLFYNQNVYDWLEGYTSEYGGGYMWRRKLDKFWDILKIWGSEKRTPTPPQRTERPSPDNR